MSGAHMLVAAVAALAFTGETAAAVVGPMAAGVASPPTQAPGDTPVPASPGPTGPAVPPAEPSASAASYAPRSALQCADFRAGAGATWTALASVSFPGPQGLVRIAAGQTVSPGAYVSGLDLAAILQARCF
jgi:hypothetical protein